jgi:hypothetical protein
VTPLVPNYRDSARQSEEPAERRAKERVLSQVVNGAANREPHEQKEREIPVRRVRSEYDDTAGDVGSLPHQTPAEQAKQRTREKPHTPE